MPMNKTLLASLAGALALGTAGCATEAASTRAEPTYEQAAANPLIPANYAAATSLLSLWLIRRVRVVADNVPPANQSAVPLGVAAEG